MTMEEFFEQFNGSSVIFDPVPSYSGDWIFTINNLKTNAKVVNGKNLYEEFYRETYQKPLEEIFKTPRILDLHVGMISQPNSDNIGRCLRYSKVDFYIELASFLSQNIDRYRKTDDEHQQYLMSLLSNISIDNDTINMAFSEALKEKALKLKDLMEKEFNSEYFEVAMQDYAPYEKKMEFADYIKSAYKITTDFQKGMLGLGDFFDRKVDHKKLSEAFDPDTFYLLFAKIIYEFSLIREQENGSLDNSYAYLYYYQNAVEEVVKTDKRYDPKIKFTLPSGKRIRYSRWNMQLDFQELMKRHPEAKSFKLPNLDDGTKEKYKDIGLMEKLTQLYASDTKANWEFLPEGEGIKRGPHSNTTYTKRIKNKDKTELINEVNMRISILENSGFIGRPIKGLNTFSGYYAFVYPNGKIILEKFWENEETMNPAVHTATYVMNIDNFIEMSKMSRINLVEYIKMFPESGIKRIFHTSVNDWQRNLYCEINGTYRMEDAIDFINSLNSGVLKNE